MKKILAISIIIIFLATCAFAQNRNRQPRENIPLDSIQLSDPFVFADKKSQTYYMTGTGGMLWRSKDLKFWSGPFWVVQHNPNSWMGERPSIWTECTNRLAMKIIYLPISRPLMRLCGWKTARPICCTATNGCKIGNVYTQGVAYSDNGRLDGHWIQENEPITPPNFGHGMLFRTFDGKLMMSIHSHKDVNGRYVRVPHFFEVDDSEDKIRIKN